MKVQELPSIDALHAEFDKDGLTVLLVDVAEPRETVAQLVTARGYTARVLLAPDGCASDAYRVQGTPTGRLDLVLLPLLLGFVALAVYRYRLTRGRTR